MTSALIFSALSASARDVVSVSVDFSAPPGCSDRETFSAGLRSRSSRIRITDNGNGGWTVGVKLVQKEHGVYGELRLSDDQGGSELRAVEGSDCAEVVEALSLTASLAIERIEAMDVPPPSNSGAIPAQTAPSRPDLSQTANPLAPPSRTTSKPKAIAPQAQLNPLASQPSDPWDSQPFHFLLSMLLTERVHPATTFGFSAALFREFRVTDVWAPELGLGVEYIPDDEIQRASELKVSYFGAALLGCPVTLPAGRLLTLGACGTFELGRQAVSDRRVETSFPSRRLALTASGLGRIRMNLSPRGAIELDLALLVPLNGRRFDAYDPAVQVGRNGPLAWRVGLGWLFGF